MAWKVCEIVIEPRLAVRHSCLGYQQVTHLSQQQRLLAQFGQPCVGMHLHQGLQQASFASCWAKLVQR